MKNDSGSGPANAEGLNSYLARGLRGTFFINIAGKGMAFASGILLARFLGPANLGIYAMALAVAQLLRLPTALGMPGLVVRYISLYDATQKWALMRGLLWRALQFTLSMSFFVAAAGSIVVWSLAARLGVEKAHALWITLWMIPMLDFAVFRGAVLQGLRRVVLAQFPDGLLRHALFLALIVIVWVTSNFQLSAVPALWIYLISVSVPFVLGGALLIRAIPSSVWHASIETDFPRWRHSMLPFMLLHSTQLLLSQIDIVMLSALRPSAEVGLYRVAWQGGELIALTLGMVNAVIQPMISRLHAQGDHARLQRMVTVTARFSMAITLPLAVILIFFGTSLLSIVFGESYTTSYTPMLILVGGQLVNVAVGSVGLLLFMTGHERDAAWAIAAGALLNIVMNLILIPRLGVEGAAIATAASLVFWNVLLFARVRQRLAIHPTIFGRYL